MEENRSLLDTGLDPEAKNNLTETARWSKFLSITILVAVALCALLMVFVWQTFSSSLLSDGGVVAPATGVGAFVFFVFFIVGAIVVILMVLLLKGANRIRLGMQNRDQVIFNSGLASLKNFFVMYGVLTVIGMLFRLLGLLAR